MKLVFSVLQTLDFSRDPKYGNPLQKQGLQARVMAFLEITGHIRKDASSKEIIVPFTDPVTGLTASMIQVSCLAGIIEPPRQVYLEAIQSAAKMVHYELWGCLERAFPDAHHPLMIILTLEHDWVRVAAQYNDRVYPLCLARQEDNPNLEAARREIRGEIEGLIAWIRRHPKRIPHAF